MGGNPWQLLTAVTAEVFYKGGEITARRALDKGRDFVLSESDSDRPRWKELLRLPQEGTTAIALAEAQVRFSSLNNDFLVLLVSEKKMFLMHDKILQRPF